MSKFGVGLRHEHFPHLVDRPQTNIDWFEVITENFMNTRGYPFEVLMKIREDYPVSLHGVGMNIGGIKDVSSGYLEKLSELISLVDPIVVSDHLCWTGLKDNNLHNLLPLSYDSETLKLLVDRVDRIQNTLNTTIAIENLSAYFCLRSSSFTEWDFLKELAKRSGCKILLDINNVYVNSKNQGFDPYTYLDAIPDELIAEFHLAGHSDMGDYLFDTHSAPACDEVWSLYHHKVKTAGHAITLFEWDEEIPEFEIVEIEALKAREIWNKVHEK